MHEAREVLLADAAVALGLKGVLLPAAVARLDQVGGEPPHVLAQHGTVPLAGHDDLMPATVGGGDPRLLEALEDLGDNQPVPPLRAGVIRPAVQAAHHAQAPHPMYAPLQHLPVPSPLQRVGVPAVKRPMQLEVAHTLDEIR
eukprot:COSAG05_NODE_4599_length_1444_cov_1.379182_2_plen_142_part_00